MRHEGSFEARQNNCNVGYGFINFVTSEDLKRFYFSFHCKRWGKFKSEKVVYIINRYVSSHTPVSRALTVSSSTSKIQKFSPIKKKNIILSSGNSNPLSTSFANKNQKYTSRKPNDHFFNFLQLSKEKQIQCLNRVTNIQYLTKRSYSD